MEKTLIGPQSCAALLLFLVLNLTGCMSWQSVDSISPTEVAEELQLPFSLDKVLDSKLRSVFGISDSEESRKVRVLTSDSIRLELKNAFIFQDELVGLKSNGFWVFKEWSEVAIPLETIQDLQFRRTDWKRSLGLLGVLFGVVVISTDSSDYAPCSGMRGTC